MNSRNFYLTALITISFILINSCKRKERITTVPLIYLAKPVRQNFSALSSITGSFHIKSEDFTYYGNFIGWKDKNLIKIKVYGPFGMKAKTIIVRPEDTKSPILKYILGLSDTIKGYALKIGNEYKFEEYKVTLNDSGDILLVGSENIKIFFSSYKKIKDVRVPFKVRVGYKNMSLTLSIKEVSIAK